MSKSSKIIIMILVIAIIGVVAFLCTAYAKNFNIFQNQSDNTTVVNNNNTVNNVVVNNTVENNTTTENTIKNETTTPELIKDSVPAATSEVESDSDESKAVSIVKKDWGDTTGVSIRVEQINGDGSYVVSVRNEDSIALEWYTVYPKTGKFTK